MEMPVIIMNLNTKAPFYGINRRGAMLIFFALVSDGIIV
jgi:hypothetical protein